MVRVSRFYLCHPPPPPPPRLLASFCPPIPRQPGRHILLWAAIDFWVKISIGLRRYRRFGSKCQQACGDIAIWVQNGNRPATISPFWLKMSIGLRRYRHFDSKSLKTSTGLRPYRHFGSKCQQACGDIVFWTQKSNRLAAISLF